MVAASGRACGSSAASCFQCAGTSMGGSGASVGATATAGSGGGSATCSRVAMAKQRMVTGSVPARSSMTGAPPSR
jgi:hypothetical protein